MPTVIDSEVRAAIEEVRAANAQLRTERTSATEEAVCIETRAAFAAFEDVSNWSGVDEVARSEILAAFRESAELLRGSPTADRFLRAVEQRIRGIERFVRVL